MHLHFREINEAFTAICRGFHTGDFCCTSTSQSTSPTGSTTCESPPMSKSPSRYGQVVKIEEPVTITYTDPLKRVLYHPVRDCNPYFHLIEALWMLAGQNRVQPLAHFTKKIGEFSDDDLTAGDIPVRGAKPQYTDLTAGYMWGAYGYRWRKWFKHDQLEQCIQILQNDRISRRVVLQMWEPTDLLRVLNAPTCKDVPCNTEVMFLPRQTEETYRFHTGQEPEERFQTELVFSPHSGSMVRRPRLQRPGDGSSGCTVLDMTVINRSNDMLWGSLGSNYVHFSFLLEYVANACGYAVGNYHQISNNLHVYTGVTTGGEETGNVRNGYWSGKWKPEDLVKAYPNAYASNGSHYNHYPLYRCPLDAQDKCDENRESFDIACTMLFSENDYIFNPLNVVWERFTVPYFHDVVEPLLKSWQSHKNKDKNMALYYARQIVPSDWRLACEQWLKRRYDKRQRAEDGGVHAVG